MARAVARREATRGLAICGSGVGACVVANKAPGMRACLIRETCSARQGVEDDDPNVLGGLLVGRAVARGPVKTFRAAESAVHKPIVIASTKLPRVDGEPA